MSRIQNLIEQATKRYEPDWNGAPAYEDFDKRKFAELIIRECANIVQDSPWQLPQGYKSVDQAKLVRKYFGVKE